MPVLGLKNRLKTRPRFFAERPQRFGQGKILTQVQQRADNLSSRVKSRKPNIVPIVNEALGRWNAGSRITEMLPVTLRKRDVSSTSKDGYQKQSSADISL